MKQTILKHLPTYLCFFGYYLAIGLVLHIVFSFNSREGIFLLEKGIIALYGAPPQLENIGLVYPPLPFVVNLPFAALKLLWGPQVVTAAATAGLATLTLSEVRKLERGRLLEILFIVVLACHPLVLYLATMGASSILYALLLATYIYLLISYAFLGKTFFLVSAGLTMGVLAFVRYETLFILMFMLPVLHIVSGGLRFHSPQASWALILMNVIPPVFAWLSWTYLNWLFTGDWLNFLRSPYAYFRNIELFALANPEMLQARHDVLGSLWIVLKKSLVVFPLFFWAILRVRNFSISWFFLAPLFALAFAAFAGLTLSTFEEYVVLIPLSVFLLAFERTSPSRMQQVVFAVLILVSIPLSLRGMLNSAHEQERQFAAMYLGQEPPQVFEHERRLAAFITSELDPTEKILLDDANGFPIVAYTKQPQRFMLPYQYMFPSAAISPASFIDAFIVARPSTPEGKSDQMNRFHEHVFDDGLPRTELLREVGPWRLYRVVNRRNGREALPTIPISHSERDSGSGIRNPNTEARNKFQ